MALQVGNTGPVMEFNIQVDPGADTTAVQRTSSTSAGMFWGGLCQLRVPTPVWCAGFRKTVREALEMSVCASSSSGAGRVIQRPPALLGIIILNVTAVLYCAVLLPHAEAAKIVFDSGEWRPGTALVCCGFAELCWVG